MTALVAGAVAVLLVHRTIRILVHRTIRSLQTADFADLHDVEWGYDMDDWLREQAEIDAAMCEQAAEVLARHDQAPPCSCHACADARARLRFYGARR